MAGGAYECDCNVHRGQKRASDLLELKLEEAASYLIKVLGTKPSPLPEQCMLLTTEQSPQSHSLSLNQASFNIMAGACKLTIASYLTDNQIDSHR